MAAASAGDISRHISWGDRDRSGVEPFCSHRGEISREGHECRFWRAAHVNHHSSREYNLSTALRQSWSSVIVGTWTPWIALALLGFPPRVHHASNPRYLDRNYAGVLMGWDRVFGTFVAERDEEPPRYGIVRNIETFNPVRIAFHEWIALVREVVAARSVREAAGALFGPPGWCADGRGLTSKNIRSSWELRHGR